MDSKNEVDLIGVAQPVCLLIYKRALHLMKSGEEVDILIQDPNVVEHLNLIISRSVDQIIKTENSDDYYRISIRKG